MTTAGLDTDDLLRTQWINTRGTNHQRHRHGSICRINCNWGQSQPPSGQALEYIIGVLWNLDKHFGRWTVVRFGVPGLWTFEFRSLGLSCWRRSRPKMLNGTRIGANWLSSRFRWTKSVIPQPPRPHMQRTLEREGIRPRYVETRWSGSSPVPVQANEIDILCRISSSRRTPGWTTLCLQNIENRVVRWDPVIAEGRRNPFDRKVVQPDDQSRRMIWYC